ENAGHGRARRRRSLQLAQRIPFRVQGVELAHLDRQLFSGHPEHLLTALLADPVRHTEALQQGDEAAEILLDWQTQGGDGGHCSASGRSTSTHTNLCGSSRVS